MEIRSSLKKKALPYAFMLPVIILLLIFRFYPILKVVGYSLLSYNINKPYLDGFVGLKNFIRIFTEDKLFFTSLLNSFRWVFSEVVLQLLLGAVVALVLNQQFRLRGIFRAIVFVPWAVSGVLTSVIWSLLYNEHIGLINDILMKYFGLSEKIAWLADTKTVFHSVVVAELWRGIPFFAIMILAALQTIPDELYESADVDGASKLQKLTGITIPYIKESIFLSTLLRAVWEFNSVDLIFNLTNGGPGSITTTLSLYIANTAMVSGDYGYGSALSMVSCLILSIFAVVYIRASKLGESN